MTVRRSLFLNFRHNSLSPKNEDRYQKIFNEIDRDKDGFIDKKEIAHGLKSKAQDTLYNEIKVPQIPPGQQNAAPSTNIPANFKDGIFIRYLWNRIHSVKLFVRKKMEAHEHKANQIIAERDSDGDGKITQNDFIDLMHENSKRTNQYFDMLDTNNDGLLTIEDIVTHPELRELNLTADEGIVFTTFIMLILLILT